MHAQKISLSFFSELDLTETALVPKWNITW